MTDIEEQEKNEKQDAYKALVKKVLERNVDANGAVLSYDKKTKKYISVKNSKGVFIVSSRLI